MDRSKLITVVLVDEYPLFRKAMADLLNATGEFQVLGQTARATRPSAFPRSAPTSS